MVTNKDVNRDQQGHTIYFTDLIYAFMYFVSFYIIVQHFGDVAVVSEELYKVEYYSLSLLTFSVIYFILFVFF